MRDYDEDIPTVGDAWQFGWKTVAFVTVIFVIGAVIAGMWIFGIGLFQRGTADFRGETAQTERVRADADYRIAQYEHFYDLCASIQGHEDTVAQLEFELANDPTEARESQLKGTITAVKSQRLRSIREYNADARKEDTAAHFRASDLPHEIDPKEKETSCIAETDD